VVGLRGASTKWDRLCESGDETRRETHVVIAGFTPRGGEWIEGDYIQKNSTRNRKDGENMQDRKHYQIARLFMISIKLIQIKSSSPCLSGVSLLGG
jgi:hypothetical protein